MYLMEHCVHNVLFIQPQWYKSFWYTPCIGRIVNRAQYVEQTIKAAVFNETNVANKGFAEVGGLWLPKR